MMAAGCYGGRRLSELLEEQQEPFLLHHDTGRRSTLGRAVRRAARLAGCFSCAARESLRRPPRADDTCDGGDDDDGGRRLSPVSVLDVLRYSDEESHSSVTLSNWEQEEEEPSSTSGSSPPTGLLTCGATSPAITLLIADEKTWARTAKEATTTRSSEEEQRIISSWERIAGDIARVPALAELDLSSSGSAPGWMPRWRRLALREASRRVGASIEAMIFEEVRAEAVRDMLSLHA